MQVLLTSEMASATLSKNYEACHIYTKISNIKAWKHNYKMIHAIFAYKCNHYATLVPMIVGWKMKIDKNWLSLLMQSWGP